MDDCLWFHSKQWLNVMLSVHLSLALARIRQEVMSKIQSPHCCVPPQRIRRHQLAYGNIPSKPNKATESTTYLIQRRPWSMPRSSLRAQSHIHRVLYCSTPTNSRQCYFYFDICIKSIHFDSHRLHLRPSQDIDIRIFILISGMIAWRGGRHFFLLKAP